MAKANTSLFYKPSKVRGVVPCREWSYFAIDELKDATVRLIGPPVQLPCGTRYAIHCFDRADGVLKVLEGPHQLFEHFAEYDRHSGHTSSGPEAPDFRIALALRPFRYLITLAGMPAVITDEQKHALVDRVLNLGLIYKLTAETHILDVTTCLGIWPRPVWPSKFQDAANAADPERLAVDGIIIRFPSRSDV